ncbi:glycoside hydrolase family 78 protein, partial [Ferruginibacter sp.]
MKIKLIIAFVFTGLIATAQVTIKNLRCEMLTNPLGIDVTQPRFSWQLESNQRNVTQISYQIIASSSEQKLKINDGDVWNSGIINDSKSLLISYGGKKLQSATKYFWKVKVITNKGAANEEETAFFSTGLLNIQDWKAKWIG